MDDTSTPTEVSVWTQTCQGRFVQKSRDIEDVPKRSRSLYLHKSFVSTYSSRREFPKPFSLLFVLSGPVKVE